MKEAQLRQDIVDEFEFDPSFDGKNSVDVLVHDGFVTLSGTVDWQYQRSAAEDDMRKLSGIVCVTNMIKIRSRIDASDIKAKIEKRHAEVEADAIRINMQATRSSWKGA